MTHDDDELISAYLDGALTPEDAARVEADPELSAQAAALGAISGRLVDVPPPDQVLRSLQIGAALDAFDAIGTAAAVPASSASEASPAADVISIGDRRRADRARDRNERPAGGRSSWLLAAAAAVVVVAGIGLAANSLGTDDFDAASVDTESADESAIVQFDAAAEEEAPADAQSAAARSLDEEAMEEAADDAMAADELFEEESIEAADDSADVEENAADGTPLTSTTTFAATAPATATEVAEALIKLDALPDRAELPELVAASTLVDPEFSVCLAQLAADEEAAAVGFVPLDVDGRLYELVVLQLVGDDVFRVVDQRCMIVG